MPHLQGHNTKLVFFLFQSLIKVLPTRSCFSVLLLFHLHPFYSRGRTLYLPDVHSLNLFLFLPVIYIKLASRLSACHGLLNEFLRCLPNTALSYTLSTTVVLFGRNLPSCCIVSEPVHDFMLIVCKIISWYA